MPPLSLRLFGTGTLTSDGAVVRAHSARTLALLAFLVLEPDRPHLRAALVDLLWSDLPAASGRQSLRQALYSLRQLAGGALGGCLQVDARSVCFQLPAPDAQPDIDVQRFLALVRSTDEADWRAASLLHRAPLLDGGPAAPGNDYAVWLESMRDRLHALAMQNLDRLVVCHLARSDWPAATGFAQSMCALDATSEAASRHLLQLGALQGQPAAVDAEWSRLCGQLRQTLGVAPSAETAALHRRLRQDGHAAPVGQAPAPAAPPAAPPASARPVAAGGDAEALVRAGQAAERVFAFSHAADLYGRALNVLRGRRPASAPRCVDVLLRLESVLERLGRRTDQAQAVDEAMAFAQGLGDLARQAAVSLRRAGVCVYLRQHPQACAAAGQALQLFRTLGDGPGEAEALRELGFVHWHADAHALALQHTREALDLHRRLGDVTGEATALHNLAEIHRSLGSPRHALPWYEQAMRLHWSAHNPAGEVLSLFGWAAALRQCGDLAASTAKLDAAQQLCAQSGERVMHARVLHALAVQQAAQGALDAALASLRRAIEIDRAIGYAHALGHDLVELADLHLLRGAAAEAQMALEEAQVWFGFTEDSDALEATRARLAGTLPNASAGATPPLGLRSGIKSHLSLGEGKVYCAFESPARVMP